MIRTLGALLIYSGGLLFGWTLAFGMIRSLLRPEGTEQPGPKPGFGIWFAVLMVLIVLLGFTVVPVIVHVMAT